MVGQAGTGVLQAAQLLHDLGPRAGAPCVRFQANQPVDLVMEELFGCVSTVFTAHGKGALERAAEGSLLVVELEELPLAGRLGLLRFLDTGCYSPIGTDRERQSHARIVAITRDVEQVAGGPLGEQLLQRFTLSFTVPLLGQHPEHLLNAARFLLSEARARLGLRTLEFGIDVVPYLTNHPWVGHLGELARAMQYCAQFAKGRVLRPQDLPPSISLASVSDEGERSFKEQVARFEGELIDAARKLRMPLRTLAHKIKSYGLKKAAV